MLAEVISIGDELTSGQRLDTNSQWLSQRLGELGVRVMWHTTVADDLEANVEVFRQATQRADVVVASGGLGPTADDLTRDVLAAVTDSELVLDEEVLERIRQMFAFFKRDMPERNRVQAMFPAGSRVIPNPNGTAPGIALEVPRAGRSSCRVYALPGVPAELFEMWNATVAVEIAEATGAKRVIRHRTIKCFGAGESHVEQMLPDLIRRGREPTVGITVSNATISLRITAAAATPEACDALMAPTAATIYECLGDLVFGEDEDELQHAVGRLLVEHGQTLSVVEWGTAGLIAHQLREVADLGDRFAGGLVVTNAATLEQVLGVPAELITDRGPIDGEVVEAMAVACRERLGTDLALAVSELPVMDRSASQSPQVFLAVASPVGVVVRSAPFAGHPSIQRVRTAKQALNLVRLSVLRAAGRTRSDESPDR